ncbi:DDHD domain-containing protein [Xylariomycetidae sp. FL0641]|nr:DDHD domain-containing protein [Xylariomycetidae sp. FL0641]
MPPTSFYYGEPPKVHTLGPQCRLAPVSTPFAPNEVDGIPPPKAQYFYTSPIPIDDPLSATALASTADPRASRGNLRPFSPGDNNALEKAWLSLASEQYRRNHCHACRSRSRSPSPSLAKANAAKLDAIIHDLALQHAEKHAHDGPRRGHSRHSDQALVNPDLDPDLSVCCPELPVDVGVALRSSFCAIARRKQHALDRDTVAQAVTAAVYKMQQQADSSLSAIEQLRGRAATVTFGQPPSTSSSQVRQPVEKPDSLPSLQVPGRRDRRARSRSQALVSPVGTDREDSAPIPNRSSLVDDGISGTPFLRVGSAETYTFSPPSSLPRSSASSIHHRQTAVNRVDEVKSHPPVPTLQSPPPERGRERWRGSTDVPVGVSRLHEVTLPALQMKPIYWSPVNDLATVLRATWFYRDDMRPLDPAVANQLEAGYRELKPHTETWSDELRCAIEVGPAGEEKVSHPLWPQPPKKSSKKKDESTELPISSNPFCAARCFRGEAAAEGNLLPTSNEDNSTILQTQRKFEHYHVIYKDETTAFLLKPSLKPSAYYGRRPVAKIAKGFTIGIPVVRGFDYEAWKKKHQKKQAEPTMAQAIHPATNDGGHRIDRDGPCPACEAEKARSQVTDLVLVVHGIGQKLAERVENYHFTHAVNAFRRAVNVELSSEPVRAVLREGQNGIMVLPVNWRQSLSFEEGGPMREEDKDNYTPEGFSLKDIEPKTIPAVRSMISDVMFDIPFYMSHHKPKVVAAMVSEANRVHRLWCQNNPGFTKKGRVHLIGHSLGSVMAIEVLSRQPTYVPALQLSRPLQTATFEFDTRNLFLLGSPAAFFLLLERGVLLPRRGRLKPGADSADVTAPDVVGEAGMFGCLAVDNLYNILAREDAVAYLLNGTLDPAYAASLKTAYVPSATPSLLESMGNAVKSIVPGTSTSSGSGANTALAKPPTIRLPSQLELEVHDFTREEMAEKKAFLLNDNGQIDYFLRSGGGPLELQYLNMLSAHTSYWVNQDLIRMLCMEIGREPGRNNTLPAMRAVKVAKRTLPSMTQQA